MAEEMMTVRGYARSRDMAHTTVDYQIRKGLIPVVDGKINPEYADFVFRDKVNKLQSQRARGQRRKHGVQDGGIGEDVQRAADKLPALPVANDDLERLRATVPRNFDEAQYLSQVEEVMKRRAANAEAEGRLTLTDKVIRAQFEMARQIRDAMFGIVPRLQDMLAAEHDPGECGRMLMAEIRLALESAAKQASEIEDDDLMGDLDAAG